MIRPIACALALWAALPATATAEQARPPAPGWHTAPEGCTWHWREGGGVGLWAERCALPTGLWEVAWAPAEAAFVEMRDGAPMRVVVQPFALPFRPGAQVHPLAPLHAALRTAGLLEKGAGCDWAPFARHPTPRTMALFTLAPAGALAPAAQGEAPGDPCGPYGQSSHAVRYVITDLRWPGRAIFVDEGQERALFEPASLRPWP